MKVKALFFLFCFFGLGTVVLMGQGGGEKQYEIKDSVNVKEKHRFRQWRYERLQSSFPAPKKDRWVVGTEKGISFLSADIQTERGLALGVNVRKSLGHTFSIRGQVGGGNSRGQNWRANRGFVNNRALNGSIDSIANYVDSTSYGFIFHNYRMRYLNFNLQGILSLNNINFYSKEPKVNLYLFGGIGGLLYRTQVDALDENNQRYDYSQVPISDAFAVRQDILNNLRGIRDGVYETQAEFYGNKPQVGNFTFIPTLSFGGGIAFKLSERLDLSLEHRVTWTADDLLDGQRWDEDNDFTANWDLLQSSYLGLNFHLGKGEAPKWWSNPLAKSFNEIRELRKYSGKDDRDSDKDGVPDQQDKEPSTPEDAVVDVEGKAVDSDGDGLQDFRDKEPFSPKGAKVDRTGVALDGDNDGIPDVHDVEPNTPEGKFVDAKGREIKGTGGGGDIIIQNKKEVDLLLPMINFDLGSTVIKPEFYPSLYYIARLMKRYPALRIRVTGHADSRNRGKSNKELSLKRASEVVKFLVASFGFPESRFEVMYKGADDPVVSEEKRQREGRIEGFQYLNRRVEFEIIDENAPGMQGPVDDGGRLKEKQPKEKKGKQDPPGKEEEDIDDDGL